MQDLLYHLKGLQIRIFRFWQKETGAKRIALALGHHKFHFVSYVMYVSGAKFKDYHSNISRDILDWIFSILVAQFTTSSFSSFA